MSNFAFKSLLGFAIFFVALLGGVLALLHKISSRRSRRIVFCGEYFSRGIFFGGGLIHMLPDAEERFRTIYPNLDFPIATTICAFSIYCLQFVEQGLSQVLHLNHHFRNNISSYVLTVLLSIHSIILGATLGVEQGLASVIIIFIAITAHKTAEAFALGINLGQSTLSERTTYHIMLLYCLMTPIGIFLGTAIQDFLYADTGHFVAAIFQAIAAGTFLYIATLNHVDIHDHMGTVSKLTQINSLGLGVLLMAILAWWV